MEIQFLHQKYLSPGTAGHAVIRRFYSKYADLLAITSLVDIDDVVNDVFLSLSKTDFTQVRNAEHYILRAVKLHCWSLLDKALRLKANVSRTEGRADENEGEGEPDYTRSVHADGQTEIEGMELLAFVNLFKAQLDPSEVRLLNLLIDETPRSEIAGLLGLKMNTLDTQIRRLRIRLADFLRDRGYSYKVLERFN